MKILCILITVASLQLSAKGYSQTFTISLKNASLENLFKTVEQQSNFRFVYSKAAIEVSKPVTLEIKNENLQIVLTRSFADQPLTYSVVEKFVIVKIKEERPPASTLPGDVTGKVINEQDDPLQGVTVASKKSGRVTITNELGEFSLTGLDDDDILVITSISYYKREVPVNGQHEFLIRLKILIGDLEETVVKGYYTVSRKLNLGTVEKVGEKVIGRQQVSNPIATLQGRVPGLFITQSNGLPGSNFSILLRGRNSIQRGIEPLFIVDGVPFNTERQTQRSIVGANNPFNLINPLDIESIEILKDAEATAIYGSRGANGVILITTKKGRPGIPTLELNVSSSFGCAQNLAEFMSTKDYIQMRKEAFKNDGITPTIANAPDLLLWDTTRNTDWKKLLTGGTARIHKLYAKLAGGNSQISYSFGSTYYKETTVFPGSSGNERVSFNLNLLHRGANKKLTAQFSSSFSSDQTLLGQGDVTDFLSLPSNAPPLYDSLGRLNWHEKNGAYNNPLSVFLKKYETNSDWSNSNFSINYKLIKSLDVKISGGYNFQQIRETSLTPIASQNPATNPTGSASFGSSTIKNWIIEPQLAFHSAIFKHTSISAQLGGSYQFKKVYSIISDASGYTNDALINSLAGATVVQSSNDFSEYKYAGLFGRVMINSHQKYLISLTGRRDGSSRFGYDSRFSNFGAVAAGWIFSEEKFFKTKMKPFSYGKLKVSYGTSGNDQIGDYMYLDTWSATNFPYTGTPVLRPTRLQNNDYHWEHKSNLEFGLETGWFKNRLLINANYFISISSDQLINYSLPGQTGFTTILKNFPAKIKNAGLELSLDLKVIEKQLWNWRINTNFTKIKNQLLEFPGLAQTPYATTYQVGKPLSINRGYLYNGVNQTTGVYQFKDVNLDGVVNTADQIFLSSFDPKFYGGVQNEFMYKNFELSFFFHFVKQQGTDVLVGNTAGTRVNMPTALADRWQKPGDIAFYQKYSTTGAPVIAATRMRMSDVAITDASYIKLRNVTIEYKAPEALVKRLRLQQFRFFVQGQNLATFTKYKGTDPEVQRLTVISPLRIVSTGFSITF